MHLIHSPPRRHRCLESPAVKLIEHVDIVEIANHQPVLGFQDPADGDIPELGLERVVFPLATPGRRVENADAIPLLESSDRIGILERGRSDSKYRRGSGQFLRLAQSQACDSRESHASFEKCRHAGFYRIQFPK